MCLASPRASEIPLADMSVKLQRAGLGEKELSIPVTADAAEVHDIIVDAFPVLKNTGYELLRTMGHGNKDFTLIGQVSSADVLKVGLKKAKCYLRPLIGGEIDLTPMKVKDGSDSVSCTVAY